LGRKEGLLSRWLRNIRECLEMGTLKVLELWTILTVQDLKETGRMVIHHGFGVIIFKMALGMKETGKMGFIMEKGYTLN